MKDTAPENRGGYKGPSLRPGTYNTSDKDLIFFELGKGGVDFPAILSHLNQIKWKGWMTVELDRTATTSKNSSRITSNTWKTCWS
jgi:sugar phosphate isomerase/epimerase